MALFNINKEIFCKSISTIIPEFQTPLGIVKLDILEEEKNINDFNIETFISEKNIILTKLITKNHFIEILSFDPKTKGLELELTNYCWLIRIEKLSDKDISFKLKCELYKNSENFISEYDGGEFIEAISFNNSKFRLSIGTDDIEYFYESSNKSYITKRIIDYLTQIELNLKSVDFSKKLFELNFVELIDTGLQITSPQLFKTEKIQFKFLISYSIYSLSKYCDDISIDSYNGVCVSPDYLISKLVSENILLDEY